MPTTRIDILDAIDNLEPTSAGGVCMVFPPMPETEEELAAYIASLPPSADDPWTADPFLPVLDPAADEQDTDDLTDEDTQAMQETDALMARYFADGLPD